MARRGDGLSNRNGTWYLEFVHKGTRHRPRLGRNISRTAALELARIERANILKGEAGIGGKKRKDIGFDEAAKLMLEWAAANTLRGTPTFYGYCVKALAASFSGKKLSEIDRFAVEKHKQKRIAQGFPTAANRDIAGLSRIFELCIEWNKFEGTNPTYKMKKRELRENARWVDHDTEEDILLAEFEEPYRTLMLMCIYSGFRMKSEVFSLQKTDVSIARQTLTVKAAYAKNGETATLPLHPKLVEPLKALLAKNTPGPWLFAREDGKQIRSLRTRFTNAVRRANLSGVKPHSLRHAFASNAAMTEGMTDPDLQALGRWKERSMIDRYVHLKDTHLAELMAKIGQNSPTSKENTATEGENSPTVVPTCKAASS